MKIAPLQIGNLRIETPLILAPMAGYTSAPFRAICRQHRCGLVFTEVTSAEGIMRRVPRTMHYLESLLEERPIAAHIYGTNPDSMARAAEVIESLGHFDLIDINCGCPVRKITGKGAGAALMREPERIQAIVQAVSEAVSLPVTVKTRLGLSRNAFNISEVAHAVEESGGKAIFLHARFASSFHSGPVDLEAMRQIREERSIPIIGNGGLATPADADEMLEETGVHGLMIGRSAIGNPWIFDEIYSSLCGKPYHPPTNIQRAEVIFTHLRTLCEFIATESRFAKSPRRVIEQAACRKFQGHLAKYLYGTPGLRNVEGILAETDSIEVAISAISKLLAQSITDNPHR